MPASPRRSRRATPKTRRIIGGNDAIKRAQELVRQARRVVVLTGAGISTDSGVPDFRGPRGVWTQDPSKQRLVDLDAWLTDANVRREGWRWLESWNLDSLVPNKGHEAVVDLYKQGKLGLCVTQNTEGLQERAGLPMSHLVTVHGSRQHVNCMGRQMGSWLDFQRKPPAWPIPAAATERPPRESCNFWCYSHELLQRVADGDPDPHCPYCGYILKTANISFGQSLVQKDLHRAMAAARTCDVLLAVGSTLSVYPVASMVPEARAAGAAVIIVNGEATELDRMAQVIVRGSISEVLPAIVQSAGSKL